MVLAGAYLPDGAPYACKNDVWQCVWPDSKLLEGLHHANLDGTIVEPEHTTTSNSSSSTCGAAEWLAQR